MTKPDSGLDLDLHHEPETGVPAWAGRQGIGMGWHGNTRVGPGGRVYWITPGGDVNRFKWLGTAWDNGGVSENIAKGWFGWGDAFYRNRMTVDARGDFYGVPDDNALHWWRYDEVGKTWTERIIDADWGTRYDLIFSAGPGVIYGRTPSGDLYRHQYDASSQRWIERARGVGVGWQFFTDVTSPGGDVLYAAERGTGSFWWYRYLGDGRWDQNSRRLVGGGIPDNWKLEMAPDGCKLTPDGTLPRLTVPVRPNAPASLGEFRRWKHPLRGAR